MTTTDFLPQTRTLVVPLSDVEWRDSGDPERKDETTLRGHAAVFNSLSEDLGGFRELIEPGFFRAALRRKPDVRLLVNHDGLPLARTASGTLELREDNRGLHVFARLDKTDPDVVSLRGKMQRGDVDQMSFAFTLREDGDDWAITEDGEVVRTLRADGAAELFDVSIVTFPAYRHTNVSMRSVLQDAISRGRVPLGHAEALFEFLTKQGSTEVAPDELEGKALASDEDERAFADFVVQNYAEPGSTEVADESQGEERDAASEAEEAEADVEQATDFLAELKERTRAARNEARESYLRLLKDNGLK